MFLRFNEINSDDKFDIHCYSEAPTGSRIKRERCVSNSWREQDANFAQAFLAHMRGEAGPPPEMYTGLQMFWQHKLGEEWLRLASQDAAFTETMKRFELAREALERLTPSVRSESRKVTPVGGALPYGATRALEVTQAASPGNTSSMPAHSRSRRGPTTFTGSRSRAKTGMNASNISRTRSGRCRASTELAGCRSTQRLERNSSSTSSSSGLELFLRVTLKANAISLAPWRIGSYCLTWARDLPGDLPVGRSLRGSWTAASRAVRCMSRDSRAHTSGHEPDLSGSIAEGLVPEAAHLAQRCGKHRLQSRANHPL